jgi:hypothetical protein
MSATIAAPYFLQIGYTPSPAVSEEGAWLSKLLQRVQDRLLRSEALAGPVREVFDQLLDVYDECSRPGWNNPDALAVSRESLRAAGRFLLSLPRDFPMPEVSADAQGEIHLEWYVNPRRIFTISFGLNILHYAGRFGASTTRGREPLDRPLPESLLNNIRRVFE